MDSFIHTLSNIDFLPKLTTSRRTPLPSSRPSPEVSRWLAPQLESQRPLSAFQKPTLEQAKEETGIEYPFKTVPPQARICTTQLWRTWNISDYPTEAEENNQEEFIEFEDSSDDSVSQPPSFFSDSDSDLDEDTDEEDIMSNIYKRWDLGEVGNGDSEFWEIIGCGDDIKDAEDADTEDDDEYGFFATPLVRY